MTTKFVTACYTNICNTKLNGRVGRDNLYLYSLRSIADIGNTIINYTNPYNISLIEPYFEEQNINNVTNIEYDLLQSPYHNKIDKIKDINNFFYTDSSWIYRCCEIMYGKFLWLEENLKDLNDEDYIFWIDCGLSAGNLIPRKFNPYHNNKKYYVPVGYTKEGIDLSVEYACRHDIIFNDKFTKKLEQYTGEKIMLLCSKHKQHGHTLDPDKLGAEWKGTGECFAIGGLFGGRKKYMTPFITKAKELVNHVLNSQWLVKEEQIMTVILEEHPEWFKTFVFDTWYHEDWAESGVFKPHMISFSKFFEDLVKL